VRITFKNKKGMKILITGGAGYVGYSLITAMAADNSIDEIILYDNLLHNNFNVFIGTEKLSKVRFIKGDILDPFNLEKAMDNVDVVIHLAAFVSLPYNHLQNFQFEQINCWGSLN